MSWYYAGPEAKPVGPIALEELHARRVSGALLPETYVIEHTGQPNESPAWKRYRDIFPSHATPPPPPVFPPVPPAAPPQSVAQPLFPSSAPITPPAFPPGARPDPYYQVKPTNGWCAWGFGLSLAALSLALCTCGLGGILALPAFFICLAGLINVRRHREQGGRGLAIAGLLLSGFTLLVSLIFFFSVLAPMIQVREETVTEQTPNDTE